jgi:hypothetical protein
MFTVTSIICSLFVTGNVCCSSSTEIADILYNTARARLVGVLTCAHLPMFGSAGISDAVCAGYCYYTPIVIRAEDFNMPVDSLIEELEIWGYMETKSFKTAPFVMTM